MLLAAAAAGNGNIVEGSSGILGVEAFDDEGFRALANRLLGDDIVLCRNCLLILLAVFTKEACFFNLGTLLFTTRIKPKY